MNRIPPLPRRIDWRTVLLVLAIMAGMLSGCSLLPGAAPEETATPEVPLVTPTPPPPEALVTFQAIVPAEPEAGERLFVAILDEVTGLALNPVLYPMERTGENEYATALAFPVGSTVKYRYVRPGAIPAEEHISDGRQVRYRAVLANNPLTVTDIVTRWSDSSYEGPIGRIQGSVLEETSNAPVVNALVTVGGAQALTRADGSFVIEGLVPGVHTLSVESLDGAYKPFMQQAQIAEEATTPAEIFLTPAEMINVTFNVTLPPDLPPVVPVRMAGNLYSLGYSFGNLQGGMTTTASRLPTLVIQSDGKASITLSLPAGADIRYKYTLGDGFWNSEHTAEGFFRIRQVILPEEDTTIEDTVIAWDDRGGSEEGAQYVPFDVQAPIEAGDSVSIQFNPFFWTEPIPMWPLGNGRFVYLLYSPLRLVDQVTVRYCLNEQCDAVLGEGAGGSVNLGARPSSLPVEEISGWSWSEAGETVALETGLNARPEAFWRGYGWIADYNPSWQAHLDNRLQAQAESGANLVVFAPTWSATRRAPAVLEAVPGQDALWQDWLELSDHAEDAGLDVAYYPQVDLGLNPLEWWADGPRDELWWIVWFERMEAFVDHHANLAATTDAQALILGGDWVQPSLPGATFVDGSSTGVPGNAELEWRLMIESASSVYEGPILWAVTYKDGAPSLPPFMDTVDGLYVTWQAGLASGEDSSPETLLANAQARLNNDLRPLAENHQIPVYLALDIPSAQGALTGCVPDPDGGCLAVRALDRPNSDIASIGLDLSAQAQAYKAILLAAEGQDWIGGIVAGGTYPPVELADKSSSVLGKPAGDLLHEAFRMYHGE